MFGNKLAGGSISDLEFIRKKILSGDWITVTGAIDAITNEIAYTPATGKTFFLYQASISMKTNPTASSTTSSNGTVVSNDQIVAALKVNTVVKDTVKIGMATQASARDYSTSAGAGDGSGFGVSSKSYFTWHGSLVGDGAKKVTIENILDDGSAIATLEGWIENT